MKLILNSYQFSQLFHQRLIRNQNFKGILDILFTATRGMGGGGGFKTLWKNKGRWFPTPHK
jgi:hypothetical protein